MLKNLTPQPIPTLFRLVLEYKADNRSPKMDLGLGVYCDAQGNTPIFEAVKHAEKYLLTTQKTKTYQPLTGHPEFAESFSRLVLGDTIPFDRIATATATGGTGALRILYELIKLSKPDAAIWIPDVTWLNHQPMAEDVGLTVKTYRYYDTQNCSVNFNGMCMDVQTAQPEDIILLHGCCHNPCGADMTPDQWETITQIIQNHNLTPLIDMAYQGFGQSLDADADGARYMAQHLPQILVAATASKNFGLYRDRIGLAMVVGANADIKSLVQGNLALLCRLNFSMGPDHGAAVVHTILSDADLTAQWQTELQSMQVRITALRHQLRDTFYAQTKSDTFHFLTKQQGMFSMLPLTAKQVAQLKDDYAIYMLPNGRISIASMQPDLMPYFVEAVTQV